MQFHAIQSNAIQYYTMQYHAIQLNTMQCHVIQCNTMKYQAISCNTIQQKCEVTMIPTQADQLVAVGMKSDTPGPSEHLRDPKTGPFGSHAGPKRGSIPQIVSGKRVTWVHSARLARRRFWVRYQKWVFHFCPLGPEKRPKRPGSGHRREKPNRRLRRHRNFGRFTPWNHPDC